MKISIVIPTKNRVSELVKCIGSVISQKIKANEVIIIDEGFIEKKSLKKIKSIIVRNHISFRYFKKKYAVGTANSKNIGIKLARGRYIFFLDDDVILDKYYIHEIMRVYKKYPNAIGVRGIVKERKMKATFLDKIKLLFRFISRDYGGVSVIGSNNSYTKIPTKIKKVEWAPAGVSSFKSEIFKKFQFDDRFYRGYSFGEDLDFSYRVSRRYDIYLTPYAKLTHKNLGSLSKDSERGFMDTFNRYYFFKKNFKKNYFNRILFMLYIVLYPLETLLKFKKEKIGKFFWGEIKGISNIFYFMFFR